MTFNGKSALVLGDNDSFWVKEFIINVLVPLGFKISLQKKPDKTERFAECYEAHNVSFVANYRLNPFLSKIPRVRVYSKKHRKLRALKLSQKYDYVFIIYVTPFELRCATEVVSDKSRVISVFIGSDILRCEGKAIQKLNQALLNTKGKVVCECEKTAAGFQDKITKTKCDAVIPFGNSILAEIDSIYPQGIKECKLNIGFPTEKLSVCIGYNANPAQQHIKVITELKDLPNSVKDKLHIVVPMGYGGNDEYTKIINDLLKKSGFTYSVMTDFLPPDQTAKLRIATDIFINAQTTDALSSSVVECLYAGSVLLNAEWLIYKELSEKGVLYHQFSRFSEIREKFDAVMQEAHLRERKYCSQLGDAFSWTTCKEKYESFLENKN